MPGMKARITIDITVNDEQYNARKPCPVIDLA